MALISRQQIQNFRNLILDSVLENFLLIVYIICFAWLITIKMSTLDGSTLRTTDHNKVSQYQFNEDLQQFFMKDQFSDISTIDDIYDYVGKVTNEKLWMKGERSPNWPVGSLRLV